MAKRVTFFLDEDVIMFLEEVGGEHQEAYLNDLLKREQQKKLSKDILRANREEAQDIEYQKVISYWDATLKDGLI